jgi:cation diffusion facilitator family transporter
MKGKSSNLAIYGALTGNAAIAISKFIAAAITGSSAMIAEGIHSTVDTGDQLLLLWGRHRSRRPPDRGHPFGHGKELYFWSLMVAVLIFGIGGGMGVYEGVTHLLHPGKLQDPTWSYVVLGISALFEGTSLTIALREFLKTKPHDRSFWQHVRRSKDPSLLAVVFEDSAALMGIGFAFLGIFLGHLTGSHYFDGIASICIGLLLALVAVALARESEGLLIGEAMDPEQTRHIAQIVEQDPAVDAAGEPLSMVLGPEQVLLNLDIAFHPGQSLEALESAVRRIEKRIRDEHPTVKRIFIEASAIGGDGAPAAPAAR